MRLNLSQATSGNLVKAEAIKNRLNLNVNHEFFVPTHTMTDASKIISKWLQRVRSVLRIHGGSVEYPFLTQDEVNSWLKNNKHRRTVYYSRDSVLQPIKSFSNTDVIDLILSNKIDIVSASILFAPIKQGEQQWKNVCNRFRTFYKPLIVARLSGVV
jgi:hypothetical protein